MRFASSSQRSTEKTAKEEKSYEKGLEVHRETGTAEPLHCTYMEILHLVHGRVSHSGHLAGLCGGGSLTQRRHALRRGPTRDRRRRQLPGRAPDQNVTWRKGEKMPQWIGQVIGIAFGMLMALLGIFAWWTKQQERKGESILKGL